MVSRRGNLLWLVGLLGLLLVSPLFAGDPAPGAKTRETPADAEYEARLKQILAARVDTNQTKTSVSPSPAPQPADTVQRPTRDSDSTVPEVSTPTNVSKAATVDSMDALDDKHRLAIGDRVSFRILEDLDDPKEPLEPRPMVVTDLGDLEIPYIGRFPAENKTCKQLSREIKAALEKEYYYHATVIIAVDLMAKTRGRVYLVGPVRLPGPQEIPSDEVLTLSKAIMRAGGFNDYADRQHVKITRKGAGGSDKSTMVVDVGQILEKGKTELDLPLEPGDLILIPERVIRF